MAYYKIPLSRGSDKGSQRRKRRVKPHAPDEVQVADSLSEGQAQRDKRRRLLRRVFEWLVVILFVFVIPALLLQVVSTVVEGNMRGKGLFHAFLLMFGLPIFLFWVLNDRSDDPRRR